MKLKKLNFYFFGDPGNYDEYNPSYVCNKNLVPEILYIIASNKPFSISNYEISNILNINTAKIDELINNLKIINAIEIKDNTYRLNFPVFLEKDTLQVQNYLKDIGQTLCNKIISLSPLINETLSKLQCSKYQTKKRILYHVLCDYIFDDIALDFFGGKNIFCTKKSQPDNRDYIIIAYENNKLIDTYSNHLLCSSNNYKSNGFTFNSFGDSDGSRKDVFRFFTMLQKSITDSNPFYNLNIAYIKILDDMNKELIKNCGELVNLIINKHPKYIDLCGNEKNLVDFLKELDYIDINELDNSISVTVPFFYSYEKPIIQDIASIILEALLPIIKDFFENLSFNLPDLTSVQHNVPIKEIGNELWHQIFGATNEYLVKTNFVQSPEKLDGEGRYLKSIILDN